MSKITLSQEVLDVLSRSTITENSLKLPNDLDRKLYVSVNKIIELAGGKWNKTAKAHLFKEDPREKLGLTLEKGEIIDEKKERQAFYTPKELAARIVDGIDLEGKSVLEPSAGCGNLADACAGKGAYVYCIERDPEEFKKISAKYRGLCADFLLTNPDHHSQYDFVIMNPPFSKNQYVKHVEHALKFLAPGGSLLAIVPNNDNPKLAKLGANTIEVFDNKEFKESGTSVSTRLIEINI